MDIFAHWKKLKRGQTIHPADKEVLGRVKNGFDLRCLPTPFFGPLRTAPVVLLYLSPGISKRTLKEAKSRKSQTSHIEGLRGYSPIGNASEWSRSRTRPFGEWEVVRGKIAVLNISPYHSKTFGKHGMLATLPSSRMSLDWVQRVLFREAVEKKRVVVCMRSASYWGLQPGMKPFGYLFAPRVTRAGHMCHTKMRDQIIKTVRRRLGTERRVPANDNP